MKNHFFDIGANVGQTFDDFLTKSPEFDGWDIWCFEPSPRHLPALMQRARELGGRYRIHVCPFGLRGDSSASRFFEKDDPRGDSFESYLASDHVTQNVENGYLLHAYAAGVADFILGNTAPSDRIVLKLDCEGSEYQLLSHLIGRPDALARIARILVEWHTIKSPVAVFGSDRLTAIYSAMGFPLERWMF